MSSSALSPRRKYRIHAALVATMSPRDARRSGRVWLKSQSTNLSKSSFDVFFRRLKDSGDIPELLPANIERSHAGPLTQSVTACAQPIFLPAQDQRMLWLKVQ